MQPHGLRRWVMEDRANRIEAHQLTETAGQLWKQCGQIAMGDDRFRDGKQGPVTTECGRALPIGVGAIMRHSLQSHVPRVIRES